MPNIFHLIGKFLRGGSNEWILDLIRFLCGGVGVRFNDDIDLGSGFKTDLFAILVSQDVFYADLAISFVGLLDTDFGFFRFAWSDGLENFAYRAP